MSTMTTPPAGGTIADAGIAALDAEPSAHGTVPHAASGAASHGTSGAASHGASGAASHGASGAIADALNRLTTQAECVVSGTQIDEYRAVLRSAMATAHRDRRGGRAPVSYTASPLHPFVIAWTTFDHAVSTLTGIDSPTVVHLSQEVRQDRPLEPGETVSLHLEVLGARRDAGGTRISFLSTLVDAQGRAFADLHTGLLAVGAERPSSFGEPRRHPVLANREWSITTSATIPLTLPARYAEVSEDANPIHLDEAAAKGAGLDGIIAHGMSVVGLVTEEAIERFADGDAERITGLGTRFSSPVVPGEPFEIAFEPAPGRIHFQCRTRRGLALKNGWIDVRP